MPFFIVDHFSNEQMTQVLGVLCNINVNVGQYFTNSNCTDDDIFWTIQKVLI
jgi:hypothetical protein